jgi:hypothetical protein
VPKLAFYTYSSSKNTVEHLYATFFDPATENGQKYAPLWYRWKDTGGKNADGKPWIAARTQTNDAQDYENCSDEIKSFFYLKAAQWPFGTMYANGMPWMSWADSSTGYAQYNHSGIMSVSVAQHTAGAFSDSVFLNNRNLNQGRGWTRTTQTNDSTAVASGANFQDQWNYVFSQGDKVNNVFVTGWNEWVAQKQAPAGSRTSCYFVDLFNEEFSRDIEMTADENGYADNFYLQLAENIRKFKGVDDRHGAAEKVASIDINSGESAWVGTEKYYDVSGDTLPRNYQSANNLILRNYTNKTGRNDIVKLRMAHDESKLYLYIECASDITAYNGTDKNWMNVLLSVDGQTGGWENYQYVVNRSFVSSGDKSVALIDRLSADGSGETIGQGEMNIDGKVMKIALPLSVLGIGSGEFTLRFKVADNVTNYNDIMNYYVNGDAAPIGRLNYVYSGK